MKTKEQQTDFKVGDMVRCMSSGFSSNCLERGKVYEVEIVIELELKLKGDDFYYLKKRFELVSTIEKEPVYGDTVWVRDLEKEKWNKAIYVDKSGNTFRCTVNDVGFKTGNTFTSHAFLSIRTTDPSLDKTTLKLSLKEIAEKYGVDEVIINE